MNNEQIEQRARRILNVWMKSAPPQTKTDEQFVEDAAELCINALVNLNEIADRMDDRDQFAMAAMTSLVERWGPSAVKDAREIAYHAYAMADVMLEARKR